MTRPALAVIDGGQADPVPHAKFAAVAGALEEAHAELTLTRREKVALDKENARLKKRITALQEQKAEEEAAAELYDPDKVRAIIRYHYEQVGAPKPEGKQIPLSGVDAVIVRWLLNVVRFTPREIGLASKAFAQEQFYREKGLISLQNMCTTKLHDERKRLKDDEKVRRWVEKGRQMLGET